MKIIGDEATFHVSNASLGKFIKKPNVFSIQEQ
jgi:hypothetical protein